MVSGMNQAKVLVDDLLTALQVAEREWKLADADTRQLKREIWMQTLVAFSGLVLHGIDPVEQESNINCRSRFQLAIWADLLAELISRRPSRSAGAADITESQA